jgi:hypothetical protein
VEGQKGGTPEITIDYHQCDTVALDHVIPRSVVPELDTRFYNLEILPSRVNRKKSADISHSILPVSQRIPEIP